MSTTRMTQILPVPGAQLAFALGRHVAWWQGSAFTKEEIVHLLQDEGIHFRVHGVETIFVHDHGQEALPEFPGFHGDVLIDALTEFGSTDRLDHFQSDFPLDIVFVNARRLFLEFYTVNHVLCHTLCSSSLHANFHSLYHNPYAPVRALRYGRYARKAGQRRCF